MRNCTLSILAAIFLSSPLLGQSYTPMASPGQSFFVHAYNPMVGNKTTIYAVKGDTLLQGQRYPLLVIEDTTGSPIDTTAILREDSLQRTLKMDFLDPNTPTVTLDFSLQAGDTLLQPSFVLPGDSNALVVDSITTYTDLQNQSRPHFHGRLLGDNATAQVEWIEGLGSLRGPAHPYPVVDAIAEGNLILACVFDASANHLFRNANVSNPCFFLAGDAITWQETSLFPQPARDLLSLESERVLHRFQLRDAQGRMVKKGNLHPARSRHKIELPELPSGMYFIQLWDEGGQEASYQVQVR